MCKCGVCGKVAGDEHGIRSHMQAKHGYDADMGPDFRYYPDYDKPTKPTSKGKRMSETQTETKKPGFFDRVKTAASEIGGAIGDAASDGYNAAKEGVSKAADVVSETASGAADSATKRWNALGTTETIAAAEVVVALVEGKIVIVKHRDAKDFHDINEALNKILAAAGR